MKTYEKALNNKYSYMVISKQIKERINKDVRVYPVYDKKLNIIGIKVILVRENKYADWMIKQTLRINEAA